MIFNATAPDERITLHVGQEKYALVFTDLAVATEFLRDLQDPALSLERLENWVLKETFLTTLELIHATRVMFDYVQGTHTAMSAPLELLRVHCKNQIGVITA